MSEMNPNNQDELETGADVQPEAEAETVENTDGGTDTDMASRVETQPGEDAQSETGETDEDGEAIETVPADSVQFSIVFNDDDDEDEHENTDTASDGEAGATDFSEPGAGTNAEENDSSASNTFEAEDEPVYHDVSADVTAANARRVNETLNLAASAEESAEALTDSTEDAQDTAEAKPAMTLASRIDRKLGAASEDDIMLKAYPTYSLNKVSATLPKSGRTVLDAANMEFHAGHTHAILVDPDDAEARVTLMSVLSGFHRPDSGAVMNRSANIAELEPVELRGHRLGIIPQRYAVRDELDAEANVLNAMDASNRNFLKPKPVIARELLNRVGLESPTTGVKTGSMPRLERVRVAIARALSCEAEVLIADEPLAGLENDEERTEILALLTTLARKGDPKHCVIIVTSDPELAEATDRTYTLAF